MRGGVAGLETDVLVLGGGFAALAAAHAAARAGASVILAADGVVGRGAPSNRATGFAVALTDEARQAHFDDTIASGRGISDPALVARLVDAAPATFEELVRDGAVFQRAKDGSFLQYRGGGHDRPRSCVTACAIRPGLTEVLLARLADTPVRIMERCACLDLLLSDDGAVSGALLLGAAGDLVSVRAGAVVLATGGGAALFDVSSAPESALGQGFSLAYRVGVTVTDLEFVQFQPFRVHAPDRLRGATLASSTLEYGAVIRDSAGVDVLASLAPGAPRTRAAVAGAMQRAIRAGGDWEGALRLDLSNAALAETLRLNPRLAAAVEGGFDPIADPIWIAPQAHFSMGGVRIDRDGRTDRPRLFAAGEAAGGLHGANRLQDNALPETLVFGRAAGRAAALTAEAAPRRAGVAPSDWAARLDPSAPPLSAALGARFADLRAALWRCAGIARDFQGLAHLDAALGAAAIGLGALRAATAADLGALARASHGVLAARLTVCAAQARVETRGAQIRVDHPDLDPALARPLPQNKADGLIERLF